ncbi:MAG: hypothetical protein ACPL1K_07160 [Candidatus Kryptoniota bacterium]
MGTKTDELMAMVESLPIDIKTKLIEKILDSLYPTQKEIDILWAEESEKKSKRDKEWKSENYSCRRSI